MLSQGRIITDPKKQEWMKRCIDNFVSQLFCMSRITEGVMQTAPSLPSLTASLPPDDNWKDIPVICITVEKVAKGSEGATIVIEQI